MRLVRLSNDCYINPEDVQEIKVGNTGHGAVITVRMRNGVGHATFADHGKTIHETLARVVAEINKGSTP